MQRATIAWKGQMGTGVAPTDSDRTSPSVSADLADSRRVEHLISPKPVGKALNLQNGQSESDQVWRTVEGIVVECNKPPSNRKSLEPTQLFWSRAASAVYDNEQQTRGVAQVSVRLPAPRRLTGVRFIGAYRLERHSSVDKPPSICDYQVYTSPDGERFTKVAARQGYVPEEQGPQWVGFDPAPVKAARIVSRQGISFIELYAPEP